MRYFLIVSTLALPFLSLNAEEKPKPIVPRGGDVDDELTEDNIGGRSSKAAQHVADYVMKDQRMFDPLLKRGEIERVDRIFALQAKEIKTENDQAEIALLASLRLQLYPTISLKKGCAGVLRDTSETSLQPNKFIFQNYKPAQVLVVKVIDKEAVIVEYHKQKIWVSGYSTSELKAGEKCVLDSVFQCSGTKIYADERGSSQEIVRIDQVPQNSLPSGNVKSEFDSDNSGPKNDPE